MKEKSQVSTLKQPEKINGFEKYEVENALETLIRAREILKDKKKVAAIKKIAVDKNEAVDDVMCQLNMEDRVSDKMRGAFGGKV
jgi:hypothetical protein